VIDHDAGRHLATLPGFPGVAGAVADDGQILVTTVAAPASPILMPAPWKPVPCSRPARDRTAL
jgi:hypothetical protein